MRSVLQMLGVVVAFATLACANPTDEVDAEARQAAIDRSRQAADALSRELAERLFAEMEAGGPLQAVSVCSEIAQEKAKAYSVDGLNVRRISMKVRNPADRPDDWEEIRLAHLEELQAQGKLPTEVIEIVESEEGRTLRYLRPLQIAPPCLNCHGDRAQFVPELQEHLTELYPDDEAFGYQLNELRGAVSVSVILP